MFFFVQESVILCVSRQSYIPRARGGKQGLRQEFRGLQSRADAAQ